MALAEGTALRVLVCGLGLYHVLRCVALTCNNLSPAIKCSVIAREAHGERIVFCTHKLIYARRMTRMCVALVLWFVRIVCTNICTLRLYIINTLAQTYYICIYHTIYMQTSYCVCMFVVLGVFKYDILIRIWDCGLSAVCAFLQARVCGYVCAPNPPASSTALSTGGQCLITAGVRCVGDTQLCCLAE